MEELKKKQRDDSDKFDAEMESICCETKKAWAFYAPPNLEAEITATMEAQRSVSAQIQVTAQEAENIMAKLHVETDGNCNRYLTKYVIYGYHIRQITRTQFPIEP